MRGPVAAFYLMPPRAWEFAIGGLLALLARTPSPRLGSLCLWLGLALMLAAIIGFDEHTRFPGSAAIVPVAGATLFILGAPAAPLAWPLRYILTTRPFVWIGLLSYSWYLWHWPLLALTRFQSLGETNRWRDAGVALWPSPPPTSPGVSWKIWSAEAGLAVLRRSHHRDGRHHDLGCAGRRVVRALSAGRSGIARRCPSRTVLRRAA